MIHTLFERQRAGLSFWRLNSIDPFRRDQSNLITISWSSRTFWPAEFLYTVEATVLTYISDQAPSAKLAKLTRRSPPKCRQPWRPKRRRGGIDTASRVSNVESRQKYDVVAEWILRRMNLRDFIESNSRLNAAIVTTGRRRMPWF